MLPLVLCRVVLFHADVNKLLMYALGNRTYTVRAINGSVIVVIMSGSSTYSDYYYNTQSPT